ncbi:uncharacterized protein LOC128882996 [Hylaeus volcanicus]|uniref:uncharacterized protein LOC128882996 n=1 Tax=Hylaeus volcanicus TaxID=313075 RepID=UPI0023B7F6C6|nr:uncharacterized protein LOC128882996 [Hylaeus volcanicus]
MSTLQPFLVGCFTMACFSVVILGLLSFIVDNSTSGVHLKDQQKPLAAQACLIAAAGYFLLGIFSFVQGQIASLYRFYSTSYSPLPECSYEEAYRLVEMKPLLQHSRKFLTNESIGACVDSAKPFWKEESFYDRETF